MCSSDLDGAPPVTGTAAAIELTIAPGRHSLLVSAAACGAPAECASAPAECRAACTSWKGDLEVGIGTEPLPFGVELPAIAASTSASPRPARKARVVTNAAFAAWLATHPDWAPEAAVGAGRAGAGYLAGWSGTTPPVGKESAPVVNVTWAAAAAYCAGRGGLPGVDDPPATWADGPGEPWLQWRDGGGKPTWRRSDGTVSTYAVPRTELSAATGFRCKG